MKEDLWAMTNQSRRASLVVMSGRAIEAEPVVMNNRRYSGPRERLFETANC
jgi:hypothetical protein